MKLNKKILKVEKVNPIDYVIYIDTDSNFISALPLVVKRNPTINIESLESNQKMVTSVLGIALEVQNYINSAYNVLSKRMFNVTNHTLEIKQEIISTTGFWLAKKRYAQWRINENGKYIKDDDKKMEVKGIDVVRTSFPAKFRTFLEEVLIMVLVKKPKEEIDKKIIDFRAALKNCTVLEVAKNTSVRFKSLDGETNFDPKNRTPFHMLKGTTAQAKAALYYNDLIKKFGLQKKVEVIYAGSKIKWVYLRDNPYNIDGLAFKADGTDPDEIMDIINMYVDKKGLYEHELKGKLMDFYSVLNWEFPSADANRLSKFIT